MLLGIFLLKNIFLKITFHPLIFFVTTFIGGIVLQRSFSLSSWHLPLFLTIIFIPISIRSQKRVFIALLLITFWAGAFSYKRQMHYHETFCLTFCNQSYDIIARVVDKQYPENSKSKEVLQLAMTELYNITTHEKKSIQASSIAYCPKKTEDIHVGDTIKLSHIFFKYPQKNSSYADYLIKEGICVSFFINDQPMLLERPQFSFARWLFEKKTQLMTLLRKKMSHRCYTLFSSLFLGNKSCNKKQFATLKEQFKYWGLSHYLARSGLHLLIFLLMLTILLRRIPISYHVKSLLLLSCSILYCILSWSSISFIRALLTYLIYALYTFFKLQVNGLHILSLVTLYILLTNPIQLFFLDFQLSFALTFALAFIYHIKQFSKKSQNPCSLGK